MSENNKKSNSAAPSSDTTSALFVSARKKQLEQQEIERREKEKEEKRLAAEAEVRRLEQEVEARRRRAEEEARRAEAEAFRMAQEAQNRPTIVAPNPNAFHTPPAAPTPVPVQKAPATARVAPSLKNNKKVLIFGGAGAVLAVVVVLILVLMGSGGSSSLMLDQVYESADLGFSFSYPTDWVVEEDLGKRALTISTPDEISGVCIMDSTDEVNRRVAGGYDVLSAAGSIINEVAAGLLGADAYELPAISLQRQGDYATGKTQFVYITWDITIEMEVMSNRMIMIFTSIDEEEPANVAPAFADIRATLVVTETVASGNGEVTLEVSTFYLNGDPAQGALYIMGDNTFTLIDANQNRIDGTWELVLQEYEGGSSTLMSFKGTNGEEMLMMVGEGGVLYYGSDDVYYPDEETAGGFEEAFGSGAVG